MKLWRIGNAVALALLALLPARALYAHVKWFSEFDFAHPPRPVQELLTPLFWALLILSMVVMAVLVPVDGWLAAHPWIQRMEAWLTRHKANSTTIMRAATAATLLLAWNNDALLVPELPITAPLLGWLQFALVLLLCLRWSTPLAGVGLLALYGYGVATHGIFYMLDYLHFVGVALYLILSNVDELRWRAIRLPVLYATVGFALIWLALEKLVYPDWGLYVLQHNPQMALGLPPTFFLPSAAFVEIGLGYLLLIGLMSRPLSVVITLVFFSTTLIFGKTEIIGHTVLHAALIVFLLNGAGTVYRPPISFHQNLRLRMAFAAINYVLVLALLLALYQYSAWQQYNLLAISPN